MTTNFKADKIRLYFYEYIKFKEGYRNNWLYHHHLKTTPIITPAGNPSKYVEIIFKRYL